MNRSILKKGGMNAAVFALMMGIDSSALAHCMASKFYMGAGVGFNSIDGYNDDATGFQIFGGYCLDLRIRDPHIKASMEIGYMDSGDFKKKYYVRRGQFLYQVEDSVSYEGAWVSFLGEYKFDKKMNALGRIGYDAGDDNGLLVGFGAGLNLSKWAQFRAEYVLRDEITSVQINWLTEF